MALRIMARQCACVFLAVTLLTAVAACQKEERTEVVVVVDSDYTVPGEIDSVVVEASDPDGNQLRSIGNLAGPEDLPAVVGLVHEGGLLGPYEVVVVGRSSGDSVVSRRAFFTFIERQILTLPMHLVRSCEGETCPSGQTCTEDGCTDEEVSGLALWSGSPVRLGGGDGDGDSDADADGDECVPEICNEVDDDCDDLVDEDFDLQTDLEHCGECDNACVAPNGTPACEAGSCAVADCDDGFDDCNFSAADGCEADLSSDADHCSGCGLSCRRGRVCCDGECADEC